MKTKWKLMASTALLLALSSRVLADLTAFDLISKGNKYIGDQSKDRVVQINSERSVGSLTPNVWHVVYYDPDSTFKCVDVKMTGTGEKLDVSHPVRPFHAPTSEKEILEKSKLKIDSDKALKLALKEPLLKNLTPKESKLALDDGDTGPVWKVQIWVAKLKKPEDTANVGTVVLSATDGTVVKSDLHPNRAR